MDAAGQRRHEEIGRRLGKYRCWTVTWPHGCKDAKDTLRQRGVDAVHTAIERAVRYPLGDDIADSRFFYTKAHIGLTLHRPDLSSDETLVHTWKAKDMLYAKTGDTKLRFDILTKRYWPSLAAIDALDEPVPRNHWQNERG